MIYLLLVSAVWGLSFGLFKDQLTDLNPHLVACIRLSLAIPLFLPFWKGRALPLSQKWHLVLIGGVQYGLMYSLLNLSFQYLLGWQVALLTIFTPLYVSILSDLNGGKFCLRNLWLSLTAVLGAGILLYQSSDWSEHITGFFLMQGSNLCFAYGQVAYRNMRSQISLKRDVDFYILLFLGGILVTSLATLITNGWSDVEKIQGSQAGALVYLGMIASGLCFFGWNLGALKVKTSVLAVANNLKIIFAILFALILFNEPANWVRLALGGGIMTAALLLAQKRKTAPAAA